MKEQYKHLPLRSGVGIVVLNQEDKIFVARRIDNPKNFWQMPQGGIDEGEDFLTAAYRELKEETSITKVELIKELDGFITYELPDHLLGIIWKGKYKGQKQKWFLLRLTCDDKDVDVLHSSHPEFDDWRWTSYWYPIRNVVSFKREVYRRALKELLPMLFNGLRSQQKPEQKSNNKPDHKKHSRRHKARRRKNPNQ